MADEVRARVTGTLTIRFSDVLVYLRPNVDLAFDGDYAYVEEEVKQYPVVEEILQLGTWDVEIDEVHYD